MKGKRLIIQYSVCQALYWMSMAALSGFQAVYLEGKGFRSGQIGTIVSVSCVFCIVIQPVLGAAADNMKKLPLKVIPLAMGILLLLLTAGLMMNPPGLVIIGIFFGMLLILQTCTQPLLNAMCMQFVNAGVNLNFGVARSLGSFGYAMVAYFLGAATKNLGYTVILPVFFVIYLLLLASLFTFEKPPLKTEDEEGQKEGDKGQVVSGEVSGRAGKDSGGLLAFLKRYPRYTLLMLGFILMLLVHNFLNTYLIFVLRETGGSEMDLGTSLFIAAFVEIPVVAFSGKIMKKLNCGSLLRIAGFFYAVKAFAVFLAPSAGFVVAAQTLQIVSSAPYIVASVYYVNNIVRRKDCVKGQVILSVATGICGILANLLGGNLLQVMPVHQILLGGTLIGVLGFAVICAATGKWLDRINN